MKRILYKLILRKNDKIFHPLLSSTRHNFMFYLKVKYTPVVVKILVTMKLIFSLTFQTHGGEHKEQFLLEPDAAQSGKILPKFQRDFINFFKTTRCHISVDITLQIYSLFNLSNSYPTLPSVNTIQSFIGHISNSRNVPTDVYL